MSSIARKPSALSPEQTTTTTLRDHLRAFEYAKMQRIVHANADTPAGAALRKKSVDAQADRTPLVPKKAPWTTEERWEGTEDGEKAREGERNIREGLRSKSTEAAAAEEGAGEEKKRKGSIGSRIGGRVVKTLTGYTKKEDEYSAYPI
jgi:purine nucleoside permease